MPKLQGGRAVTLKEDEYHRVLRIVSTTRYAKRDRLIFLLSFGLGLRAKEIAGLKINQFLVPFNQEEIWLKEIRLTKTKGDKPRSTVINDVDLKKALREYIDERKETCKQESIEFNYEDPLILSQKGGAFSAKTIQKRFETLYKLAGIYGASSHSGRRTFGTRVYFMTRDVKTTSTLLGHSSTHVTSKCYIDDNQFIIEDIMAKVLY